MLRDKATAYLAGIDQLDAPEIEDVMTGFAKACLVELLEELSENSWESESGYMSYDLWFIEDFVKENLK
jgi:hypothetical protein